MDKEKPLRGPRSGPHPRLDLTPCSHALLGRGGTQPHAPLPSSATAFFCPWVPLIPILGITANIYLMINLNPLTWLRFAIWLVVGIAFYGIYGARHSRLRNRNTVTAASDNHSDSRHLLGGDHDHEYDARTGKESKKIGQGVEGGKEGGEGTGGSTAGGAST